LKYVVIRYQNDGIAVCRVRYDGILSAMRRWSKEVEQA